VIEWAKPAQAVHDHIRGLSPFPGAYFTADFGKGQERVKVLRATLAAGSGAPGTLLDNNGIISCGDGAIRLVQVQRAGKGPVAFDEFLRGVRLGPGARFG